MRRADRLIINVLSNYGLTLLAGAASLVIVPLVIGSLTQGGYGLAAMLLATYSITETLAMAVNRAMQRYLPLDFASDDPSRASVTFNSAVLCHTMIGIVAAIVVWFVKDWYIEDPGLSEALRSDGRLAGTLLCVTLIFGAPLFAYRAALEAIERFDLAVFYVSGGLLLRIASIILFFKLGHPSITLFVISHPVLMIIAYLFCRRALKRAVPDLRESPFLISRTSLKVLLVFAGGGLLVTSGNVLGQEGFRILVGKELSMADAGGLSAVWTFRALVFMTINSMTNVLLPTVSNLDARGSSENVAKLFMFSAKYAALAAASVCIVPIAIADSFLKLWLGPEFLSLRGVLYTVMLSHIPLAVAISSQQVLVGLGRMKVTGPTVFIRGGGSLLVAWLYVVLSAEPSLVGAAITLYGFQAIVSLFLFAYGFRVTQVGIRRGVVEGLLRPLCFALLAGVLTWWLGQQLGEDRWWSLLVCIAIGELAFLTLILTLGLTAEERERFASFLGRVRTKLCGMMAAGANRAKP